MSDYILRERGRTLLLVILGVVVGLDLLTTFGASMFFGLDVGVRGIVRILLTVGLAFAVFTGKSWARWTLGVLLCLGSLLSLMTAFTSGAFFGAGAAAIFLVLGAIHGVGGVLLLSSKAITRYMGSFDTLRY